MILKEIYKKVLIYHKTGHESAVNTVKFMPFKESTTFATGSDDSCIRLFDLRKIDIVSVFQD